MIRYILFLFLSIFFADAFSQNMEQQTSYFNSRIRDPVKIEVRNAGKEITFMAENISYYPYQIEIEFTNFINLSPMMNTYKSVLNHGTSTLFRLTIVDGNSPHDYAYNSKYKIGYANQTALINYPYPVPLRDGKAIKLFSSVINNDSVFYQNKFVMNSGDTVVCMRKGIITNILSSDQNQDRILQTSSVEILHEDGTVASYSISGDNIILINPGQNVYPLQPLVVLKKPGILDVQMFDINNGLKPLEFIMEVGEEKIENSNVKYVIHTISDVQRELTNKELKKLSKGDLY